MFSKYTSASGDFAKGTKASSDLEEAKGVRISTTRSRKTKQVNEDEILSDAARMMETEETVQAVLTVLGIKVLELQKAQEEDAKYGPIVRNLRDKLPQVEEEVKYFFYDQPLCLRCMMAYCSSVGRPRT